jgi:hypothetical protein
LTVNQKTSIEQDDEALLDRGDAAEGDSYQAEDHSSEGVAVVKRKTGERMFFSERYMKAMRKRNRARGG